MKIRKRDERRRRAMDLQLRNFPLVFTLAAAVVTPAFGPAAAGTVGPANGGRAKAPTVPAFSGVLGHPPLGLHPRPSGPTAPAHRSPPPPHTPTILTTAAHHTP